MQGPPWLSAHENALLEEPATRILSSHLTDPGSFPCVISVKSLRSALRTARTLAEEAGAAPSPSTLLLPGAVPQGRGCPAPTSSSLSAAIAPNLTASGPVSFL